MSAYASMSTASSSGQAGNDQYTPYAGYSESGGVRSQSTDDDDASDSRDHNALAPIMRQTMHYSNAPYDAPESEGDYENEDDDGNETEDEDDDEGEERERGRERQNEDEEDDDDEVDDDENAEHPPHYPHSLPRQVRHHDDGPDTDDDDEPNADEEDSEDLREIRHDDNSDRFADHVNLRANSKSRDWDVRHGNDGRRRGTPMGIASERSCDFFAKLRDSNSGNYGPHYESWQQTTSRPSPFHLQPPPLPPLPLPPPPPLPLPVPRPPLHQRHPPPEPPMEPAVRVGKRVRRRPQRWDGDDAPSERRRRVSSSGRGMPVSDSGLPSVGHTHGPQTNPEQDADSTATIKSIESVVEFPPLDDAVADMRVTLPAIQNRCPSLRDLVDSFHTWQHRIVSHQAAQLKFLHVYLKRRLRKRTSRLVEYERAEEDALRNARCAVRNDEKESNDDPEGQSDAVESVTDNRIQGNEVVPFEIRLPLEAYLPRRVKPMSSKSTPVDPRSLLPQAPRPLHGKSPNGKLWLTLPTVLASSEWNSRKSQGPQLGPPATPTTGDAVEDDRN